MFEKMMTWGAGLLALAFLVPTMGYHIDGNDVPDDIPVGNMASSDWAMGAPGLILCEDTSDATTSGDDRLGASPFAVGNHGVGGLCTTGENDATGTQPYANATGFPVMPPNNGTYIQLDVCDRLTAQRNGGNFGPYANGGNSCESALGGSLDKHAFTAEIGSFTCFVPTDNPASGQYTGNDWALFYDRLYAWWTYDGDGWYTPGNNIGEAHGTQTGSLGSGGADGFATDNDGPHNQAGLASDPANWTFDNEDAWHGHVAVFIQMDDSESGANTFGSVDTRVATSLPSGLTDDAGVPGPPVNYGNNCGGSPSNAPSGYLGPVIRGERTT